MPSVPIGRRIRGLRVKLRHTGQIDPRQLPRLREGIFGSPGRWRPINGFPQIGEFISRSFAKEPNGAALNCRRRHIERGSCYPNFRKCLAIPRARRRTVDRPASGPPSGRNGGPTSSGIEWILPRCRLLAPAWREREREHGGQPEPDNRRARHALRKQGQTTPSGKVESNNSVEGHATI